jgi:catechol 2,3-dioxygenase-like lactoylglutathione lyase family enzyme
MPNLENLKKRAKLYLRWHRERYFPVAARIRALLPDYRQMSDVDVLAANFQLADAQRLVAIASGFETWEALRKGLEIMPSDQTTRSAKPTLLAAEPQLFVANVAAAVAFYEAKLGFTLVFTWGEPPFYAQVARDGARLNLRHTDQPAFNPALRDGQQMLSASITVDDAKALFLEFQAVGVDFAQTLKSEPWDARTFIIRDPDGNLILFAGASPG